MCAVLRMLNSITVTDSYSTTTFNPKIKIAVLSVLVTPPDAVFS